MLGCTTILKQFRCKVAIYSFVRNKITSPIDSKALYSIIKTIFSFGSAVVGNLHVVTQCHAFKAKNLGWEHKRKHIHRDWQVKLHRMARRL